VEKYDICVIGGGPSGYAAAMRAIDFGKKTILIERGKIGGASIYNGALTSKTTWEVSSRIASINEMLEQSDRPFFEIPWQDVRQTVSEAVFDRKQQYSAHLKLLKEETSSVRFRHARGAGKFLSKNEIQITSKKGEEVIWAENTIVATGSRPRKLPHIETDEQLIMTSDGIDYIEDYPKSLVILGAGVIGCEYATIFSNFGKTKVYLIDRADRILPFEDEDIAGMVSQNLRANGVTIHKLAKLERMEVVDGEVEYEISNPDGTSEVIRVEKALLSVGRIPNTEELGLENAGVDISDRNHILDTNTQTSIPNIYAVGDVTGHIALVNVGEIEGRYAVEKIVGEEVGDMTYDNVCTIMFLHPSYNASSKENQSRLLSLILAVLPEPLLCVKPKGFSKLSSRMMRTCGFLECERLANMLQARYKPLGF